MKAFSLSLLAASACLFSCVKDSTNVPPVDNTYKPTGTLDSGLVAYYAFTGNTLDSTSNHNNGIASAGASLTTNRFGVANKAYAFNGQNGYIKIPNSTSTDLRGDFSISLWVNPDVTATTFNTSMLVFRGDTDPAHDPYSLTYQNELLNTGLAIFSGPGTTSDYQDVYMPESQRFRNVWVHVIATCNKTTNVLKIYANGLLVNSATYSNLALDYPTNGPSFYTALGCADETHSLFKGSMDEVRIYNRVLTATEALELANVKD